MNQDFQNAHVLITGGAGFIGSHLARRLVHLGAKVTIVDSLMPEYGCNLYNLDDIKDQISLNISDVRDPYAMRHLIQGQDFLFNLAGQSSHADSMTDPFTDLEINAKAQLSILEACKHHNTSIKIVFASTRQIYGRPQYLPVDENHPIVPVDVNGINKWSGEWYHLLYNNVYGIRSNVLRLTNTYGPAMRVKDARQTFLGIWLKLALEGQSIKVFGDGKQLRDFNYVDDVVDAMLLSAVSQHWGQIFNLGHHEVFGLEAVAQILSELIPGATYQKIEFPPERKAIDIGDYYSDYTKIKNTLGWSPKVSLREGLQKSLEYYKQALPHYL
jgi:UDP-glucose 4-epimerase